MFLKQKNDETISIHQTKSYLYFCFNVYTGETLYYQVAENDCKAILNVLNVSTVPLTHMELYRACSVTKTTLPVAPDSDIKLDFSNTVDYTDFKPVLVSWQNCKLPENEAEALAPLGLSADEVKQIVQQQQERLTIKRR